MERCQMPRLHGASHPSDRPGVRGCVAVRHYSFSCRLPALSAAASSFLPDGYHASRAHFPSRREGSLRTVSGDTVDLDLRRAAPPAAECELAGYGVSRSATRIV